WDTTFGGGDGIADSGLTGHGEAIALAADGSILVAGSPDSGANITGRIAVVRYHPDGTLDPSFGAGGDDGDGIVTAESGYSDTAGFILAVAPNGKILVGIDGASVTRFTANGQLDTTFDGGRVFPPSGHGQT